MAPGIHHLAVFSLGCRCQSLHCTLSLECLSVVFANFDTPDLLRLSFTQSILVFDAFPLDLLPLSCHSFNDFVIMACAEVVVVVVVIVIVVVLQTNSLQRPFEL